MKRFLSALLTVSVIVWAQDEPKGDPESEFDAVKLLSEIVKANEATDITELSGLMEDVTTFAKAAKTAAEVDPIAAELGRSLKVAKGNHGTQKRILAALGELATHGQIEQRVAHRLAEEALVVDDQHARSRSHRAL